MRWLLLTLALIGQLGFAQTFPTDEEAFTQMAAERVSRELPDYNVRPVGQLTLKGKRADGESTGEMSLDRVYAFCRRNPPSCRAALDEYAQAMADSIKERNRPVERSMVRLAVRPTEYIERLRQQLESRGGKGVVYARAVAPGLVAVPVIDFTRSVRFVNDADLVKLSLSEDELFRLGEQNLRSSIRPLPEVAPTPAAYSLGRIAGEDYASSRMLLHDDWRELSTKLNNHLVIMLPAPDVLLYGDGSTAAGVDALRTFAAQVVRMSSRPLSPLMLRWTEDGWDVVR